jgi:hypothetical protein
MRKQGLLNSNWASAVINVGSRLVEGRDLKQGTPKIRKNKKEFTTQNCFPSKQVHPKSHRYRFLKTKKGSHALMRSALLECAD